MWANHKAPLTSDRTKHLPWCTAWCTAPHSTPRVAHGLKLTRNTILDHWPGPVLSRTPILTLLSWFQSIVLCSWSSGDLLHTWNLVLRSTTRWREQPPIISVTVGDNKSPSIVLYQIRLNGVTFVVLIINFRTRPVFHRWPLIFRVPKSVVMSLVKTTMSIWSTRVRCIN